MAVLFKRIRARLCRSLPVEVMLTGLLSVCGRLVWSRAGPTVCWLLCFVGVIVWGVFVVILVEEQKQGEAGGTRAGFVQSH